KVISVHDKPARVIFKRKEQKVREIINIWRVDDTWWHKPVARMYYSLEFESGTRITVFQDLLDGSWYRQNWAV
ncbi:MAG: hypothetical protein ACYDHW_15505, partial [Syntrophorhabdaceae bacterium]